MQTGFVKHTQFKGYMHTALRTILMALTVTFEVRICLKGSQVVFRG